MPRPPKQSPSQVLEMIREEACAYRDAGFSVLEIEGDGWRVKLAPIEAAPSKSDDAPAAPMPDLDPLNDPATWGMPPGTHPPGFKHRVQRDEEP